MKKSFLTCRTLSQVFSRARAAGYSYVLISSGSPELELYLVDADEEVLRILGTGDFLDLSHFFNIHCVDNVAVCYSTPRGFHFYK